MGLQARRAPAPSGPRLRACSRIHCRRSSMRRPLPRAARATRGHRLRPARRRHGSMVGGRSAAMGTAQVSAYIEPMFRAVACKGYPTGRAGQCAVCHAWPAQPLCEACVARLRSPLPALPTCALPVPAGVRQCGACRRHAAAAGRLRGRRAYAYPVVGLHRALQVPAQPGWARAFAMLMRSTPWVEPALEPADLVLPMPWRRSGCASAASTRPC
jgi:hypothetical protein